MFDSCLIKQVATQIRGVSYDKNQSSDNERNGYYPILRAHNIQEGKINYKDLIYVDKNVVSETQLLKKGDIIIATSSGSVNLVGKAGYFSDEELISFGAFCKVVRANNERVHPKFLFYYFLTDEYKRKIRGFAEGANINNLRNEHIDNLIIPLPPLAVQQKITQVLDEADVLIQKRKQAIDKLDLVEKALFYEIVREINDKGTHMERPLSEFICFMTSGSRGWAKYYSKEGEKFITIKNVNNGVLNFNQVTYVEAPTNKEAERTKVKENDLLISITADLGRTAVVDKQTADNGAYINQHLCLIRLNCGEINPHFVSAYLQSVYGQTQFKKLDQVGVKSGLNFEAIKSLRVLSPDLQIQKKFEEQITQLRYQKQIMQQQLTKLEENFNALLHRAFKGELELR